MQDPWLSLNHSKLAQSPQCHEVHNMAVGDLMVPKIKDFIISTAMTEAITSISLFLEDQDDTVIWNEELHGKYSVRSGYRFAMEEMSYEKKRCARGVTKVVEGPCPSANLYSYLVDLEKMLTDGRKIAVTAFSCPNHCELYHDYLENGWHVFFRFATSIEC